MCVLLGTLKYFQQETASIKHFHHHHHNFFPRQELLRLEKFQGQYQRITNNHIVGISSEWKSGRRFLNSTAAVL